MRIISGLVSGIKYDAFVNSRGLHRFTSNAALQAGRITVCAATDVAKAKQTLMDAIAPTNRGGTASSSQRAAVLSAQVMAWPKLLLGLSLTELSIF